MTKTHQRIANLLKFANPQTFAGACIITALEKPDMVPQMVLDLIDQAKDNPRAMFHVLGFDILKEPADLVNVEKLNEDLAKARQPFRVVEEIVVTDRTAIWVGRSGYHFNVTLWVDSFLNRYLVHANGQVFQCTNTDLVNLPEHDKQELRAILGGHY